MKIYTKTGDAGKTSLVNGRRIEKNDPLLEAYGTIDELNAVVGVVIEELRAETHIQVDDIVPFLLQIQNRLFTVGGLLATDLEYWEKYWKSSPLASWTEALESEIDRLSAELPAFDGFILPSGSKSVAYIHLARTVCRRAERSICRLELTSTDSLLVLKYVNRLSDYFYILAKKVLQIKHINVIYWKSEE